MHRILQTSQTSSKVSAKKVIEYKDLIYAIERNFENVPLSDKERKYLKLFNTKNAFYNFVYLMLKFNDLSVNPEIYDLISETLEQLEDEELIDPDRLKIQDRLLYNAFRENRLKTVKILMKIRDFLTHWRENSVDAVRRDNLIAIRLALWDYNKCLDKALKENP